MGTALEQSASALNEAGAKSGATGALCPHCGLAAAPSGGYCCYGCEIAAEIAAEGERNQLKLKGTLLFSLLLSMSVMMLSLFLFAEDVYPPDSSMRWLRSAYRIASALLATPVVLLLGFPLCKRSLEELRKGRLSMELFVGLGALSAYALSLLAVFRDKGGVYFDSATSALLLATLGRYLEASARAKASRLLGPTLKLVGEPVEVLGHGLLAASAIEPGMRFSVRLEQAVPVDAEVLTRPVEVNLGVVTGTAGAVLLKPGERVPAGAIPVSGPMEAIALRRARESTLEQLAALAKNLKDRPCRLQRVADVFAAALLPIVLILATISLIAHGLQSSPAHGIEAALAVVLAACPCTYGVATPLVLWLALRKALEHGVCIRNANVLEELASIRKVAFDKTGTLTKASLELLSVKVNPGEAIEQAELIALAAAMEGQSRHPIASAFRSALAAQKDFASELKIIKIENLHHEVGKGLNGIDGEGRAIVLGSADYLSEHHIALSEDLLKNTAEDGSPRVHLARAGKWLASFSIGECLRDEAKEALSQLKAQGIESLMITGDSEAGAQAIAGELGIEARAGLRADQKVGVLSELGSHVAMVGDGLNDAPALAGTRPSFAMEEGTGLSRAMSQISLQKADLRLVPWTIELARHTLRIARRNLVASTLYNLVFLTLAALGILRPVWAGISMLTSSLLVLASSLELNASSQNPSKQGEQNP